MSDGDELERLVAEQVEGLLDEAGQRRLGALLANDDAARAVAVDQARVHLVLAATLRHAVPAETARRARLIAGTLAPERRSQVVDSARNLRPHFLRSHVRRPALHAWPTFATVAGLLLTALVAGWWWSRPTITPALLIAATPGISTGNGARMSAGQALSSGDALTTGANASATLGWADEDTRIEIASSTRLRLLPSPGKRLELEHGRVRVDAAPQPVERPLVIVTPRAELTVVGTAFSVSADPMLTWLNVEHGTVRLGRPGDLPLEVGAGQRALAAEAVRVVPSDRGCGLIGRYYDGDDFSRLALVRLDPVVDFDWGDRGVDARVERARFSVRWTGLLEPRHDEVYRFWVASDDGARLWIDDRLVVSDWQIQSVNYKSPASGTIALHAGRKVRIRLEYFEHESLAAVRLGWESPSQPREVIPSDRLYPDQPENP